MSEFTTLAGRFEYREDIRKSRFWAQASPVADATAALDFVAEVSDPVATHNCWAYRIGSQYRFNDDGEPGGTAGRPILQAIEGQGCDRVVVVVTRWFGGIKLGSGGLVRAYGGSAAQCLRLAPREPIVVLARGHGSFDFAELPLLRARLAELGGRIEDESFHERGAQLTLTVPVAHAADATTLASNLTRGRTQLAWDDA